MDLNLGAIEYELIVLAWSYTSLEFILIFFSEFP